MSDQPRHWYEELDGGRCECGFPASDHVHHMYVVPWCDNCKRENLTPRQVAIRDFIVATVSERGFPPTVREIGVAVGLTSSSSVHAQLANLVRAGVLQKVPESPRAIQVVTE